jgi:Lrp/AsnC family leucine-responsive transcriptional regulator
MADNKEIKLDDINRKILAIIHKESDISNQELAERVCLSNSACFQRTKVLKESGLLKSFTCDLDLNQIVENVLAYVEFTLENNSPKSRMLFEQAIENFPEFMDCLRVTGDTDYISFTCCSNTQALNELCDNIGGDPSLGVQKIKTRIIVERSKWYLGYPLEKLKWLK